MSFGQALIVYFIDPLLGLLILLIFVGVIMSWLVAFNVLNPHNQLVRAIWRFTNAVTEPLLRPIRQVIPPLGGMDFSPLILLLVVFFVRDWLVRDQLFRLLG
ncbi:YggT family protein [Marinicauda salina]|jgi:YggT family protein|uniref:YggT family protein n=1 Tax=Marinicauda salina TaxID=2135793 RepID=A0A2U2BW64_9PROT|nr:YggT family protein [Marinicauda salina]PWE18214.1 YggT family protein [Marinicauda salina]